MDILIWVLKQSSNSEYNVDMNMQFAFQMDCYGISVTSLVLSIDQMYSTCSWAGVNKVQIIFQSQLQQRTFHLF